MRVTACVLLIAVSSIVGVQPPREENNLVYEIFVRSFADSNGDGIGDLNGITAKLDSYLNDGKPETDHDLEVGALWLMPIFPSPSYHGYDVTDYRAINPQYGSVEDFGRLVTAAHARGVRVIIDLPINHTSRAHPWFTEALNDPSSPRRAFYRIAPDDGPLPPRWRRATASSGTALRYFGLFSAAMPDLVFDHMAVRDEVKAIAKFWLNRGVDGFRLDAAKHVYGDHFGDKPFTDDEIAANNAWWREFTRAVYAIRPDAVLLGEVLGDREIARRHAWGLDGLLEDGFMDALRAQLIAPKTGFVTEWQQFQTAARTVNAVAHDVSPSDPHRPFHVFPFVGSHDRNPRLASDLEEAARRGELTNADGSFRIAMYVLLSLSSHPVWYAGDELMQRGWKWRGNPVDHPTEPGDGSRIFDETLREPFPWYRSGAGAGQTTWLTPRFDRPDDGVSREEQDRAGGMLQLFRALTNLRTRHPVLANGEIGAVLADATDAIGFERTDGSIRYLILINRTETPRDYRFRDGWFPQYIGADFIFWSDGGRRTWKDLSAPRQRIERSVAVPAYGMVVLRTGH